MFYLVALPFTQEEKEAGKGESLSSGVKAELVRV